MGVYLALKVLIQQIGQERLGRLISRFVGLRHDRASWENRVHSVPYHKKNVAANKTCASRNIHETRVYAELPAGVRRAWSKLHHQMAVFLLLRRNFFELS